jgi:hypothetical protein
MATQPFHEVYTTMRPTNEIRPKPSLLARLLVFAAVAAIFALAPSVAHADSNTTYNFAGTMSNGLSFTGTLDFDTVGGVTSLVDTTINLAGLTFTCDGASSNLCLVQNSGFSQYFQTLDGSALFLLSWNPVNFNNPPSTLTFNGGYCMNCAVGTVLIVTGGTATVAPEPETIMLLAAGLVALIGATRRKRILGSEL